MRSVERRASIPPGTDRRRGERCWRAVSVHPAQEPLPPHKESGAAHFVCALALIIAEHRVYTVCERVDGFIAFEASGSTGFGYDPIFIVEEVGAPMATLPEGEKDKYSHRALASRKMNMIMKEYE